MKTKLAITDLTRMYQGRVCIAGYTSEHTCIRPVLPPPGIPESALIDNGKPIIFPFALVEFNLLNYKSQPPHTEDWFFDPESINFIRAIKDRRTVLDWSLFNHLNEIFELPFHDDYGFYVMDCEGARSLGTIKPTQVYKVIYESEMDGSWDYRLIFSDGSGTNYRLKITDLTWRYYCDNMRERRIYPAEISEQLTETLQSAEVYLRIGLARGWSKFPDRCYIQINAIHTFPDYLEGKTFLDYAPYKST